MEAQTLVVLTEDAKGCYNLHSYRITVSMSDPYDPKCTKMQLLRKETVSGPGISVPRAKLFLSDEGTLALIAYNNKIISVPIN